MSNARMAVLIGILTAISLLFYTTASDNSQIVTRIGLTLSIVEQGALTIDRIADQTVDKSLVNGHYYADKAPGLSLLAVLPVGIVKLARDALGIAGDSTDPAIFTTYMQVGTLFVVVLPAALAAALGFLFAQRLGAGQRAALTGALAIAIGSPFFFWSTAFFAHSLVGSLLVFILVLSANPERWDLVRGLAVGALAGLTVVVDFVGGFVLLVAGVVLLIMVWRPVRPAHLRFAFGVIAGAVVGILPLPIYNYLAFGSPFQLGYMNVVGFEGMKTGFFGIGLPNPLVVLEILFGGYRGLVPLAPILLLVPYGLVMMARARPQNAPVVGVIVAVALVFILINAGYVYWDGGWSTGPRHVVPMLPLLGLALAFAWPTGRWTRAAALVLLGWGLLMTALVTSLWMFAPSGLDWPIIDIYFAELPKLSTWINLWPMLPAWIGFALLYRRATP